jgi:hypothetical protein
MVSKTKTKTRKKGRQTKESKKSKPNLKKRSGVKKARVKSTSTAVTRPKKVTPNRKKITTAPLIDTAYPSEQESTSLLTEKNTSSANEDATVSGIQGESEIGTSDEEMTSSYTSITELGEDNDVKDNSNMSETM